MQLNACMPIGSKQICSTKIFQIAKKSRLSQKSVFEQKIEIHGSSERIAECHYVTQNVKNVRFKHHESSLIQQKGEEAAHEKNRLK
jgi:hypothetical protein